jgi:hypothetical protein
MSHHGRHIFAPIPVIAHEQFYTLAEGDLAAASPQKFVLFNLGRGVNNVYFRAAQIFR